MKDTKGINGNGPDTRAGKYGGKEISKTAQIFAALWIVTLTVLKGLGLVRLEIEEIIYSGVSIAAIFMPVYFSIWLEKIRDIRFGGK
jgi:hypothetical protein